ncbi:MAG TPA: outer membrane beta-barrel protein [Bacteroidales bacterium]|nr:outer membrane beta-barrel protein [Bacteroidales bacterium]
MKKLVIKLVFLFPLFFPVSINAQKFDYGVFVGGNLNFLSARSNYEIKNDLKFKPGFSYNLGGNVTTRIKMINLSVSIEYSRIRNTYNQSFWRIDGSPILESKACITNHYIEVSGLGTMEIVRGLNVGVGLSGNYLLKSSMKLNAAINSAGQEMENDLISHTYRKIKFSIPVIIEYEIKKIRFFTRFNIGVMNRLNGDSFVKEIENPLVFGIGFRLNK